MAEGFVSLYRIAKSRSYGIELDYENGEHKWRYGDSKKSIREEMESEHPTVFTSEEAAIDYALNVAKLDKESFRIQQFWHNKAFM